MNNGGFFSLGNDFLKGCLGGSAGKNLPANARDTGDMDSIPGWERSPGGRNGSPL